MRKNVRTRSLAAGGILLALVVAYALYLPAGSFSAIGWQSISLLCPLGALSTLFASKLLIPKVVVSLAIAAVLILLFGRAFCAWICPVPLISRIRPDKGKAADGEQKGPAASPARTQAKADSRHFILLACLATSAVFAFPVFCLVCPIGLSFALAFFIVRLFAYGEATWAIVLIAGVLAVELLVFRKWCRLICPLGALMSLVAKGNKTFVPHADEGACLSSKGLACNLCAATCPEAIDPRNPKLGERAISECTKCRICVDGCPAHAITMPFLPAREGGGAKAAKGDAEGSEEQLG